MKLSSVLTKRLLDKLPQPDFLRLRSIYQPGIRAD
jgi:hypothetical protein